LLISVTVSGRSGLTNAYTSALSAAGPDARIVPVHPADSALIDLVRPGDVVDVVAASDGPRRPHLGALVTLAAHDERRLAHAVEAPDLLVQQARQQNGAIHPDQIGVGEAELAVAVVEVEGGEVLLLDGLTHGFPLREVVRMSWMRPTSARRRSARRLAASAVVMPRDAAWAMTLEVVSKMRRTLA